MNVIIQYYRSKGVNIGKNTRIFSSPVTSEPYLITIGNNVTISTNVKFITHDNSISKVIDAYSDIIGEISIMDNCFIGANSILLPGIKIGENTIVSSGSVVTKSYLNGNVVIGGNPAKVICSINEYKEKVKGRALDTRGMTYKEKREYIINNKEKLIYK